MSGVDNANADLLSSSQNWRYVATDKGEKVLDFMFLQNTGNQFTSMLSAYGINLGKIKRFYSEHLEN